MAWPNFSINSKGRVTFKQFNLLNDVYPNSFQNMDIIFYRNVSIYFEPETRIKIFRKLSEILTAKLMKAAGRQILSQQKPIP